MVRDSHYKPKSVIKPSWGYNGISFQWTEALIDRDCFTNCYILATNSKESHVDINNSLKYFTVNKTSGLQDFGPYLFKWHRLDSHIQFFSNLFAGSLYCRWEHYSLQHQQVFTWILISWWKSDIFDMLERLSLHIAHFVRLILSSLRNRTKKGHSLVLHLSRTKSQMTTSRHTEFNWCEHKFSEE